MAVRHGYGKIAGADALVFAYDTGDTINSYKGRPTTNFFTNGHFAGGTGITQEGGSNATNEVIYFPNNPGGSDYVLRQAMGIAQTEYQINLTTQLASSTTYVMSGWYGESPDYVGESRMFHARAFSSTGAHNATGTGIGTVLKTVEIGGITWKYCYQTITTPSDYSNNFNWYVGYSGTSYTGVRYYTNIMMEQGTVPSQFVNGTRPSTQGLLDLTGNRTIDLTNAGFDSNAQISLDGSNDSFETTSNLGNLTDLSAGTVELVFKWTSGTDYTVLIHAFSGTSYYGMTVGLGNWTGGYSDESIYLFVNEADGTQRVNSFYRNGHYTYRDGLYHHLVFTVGDNTVKGYLDGTEISLTSSSGTKLTQSSVTKLQVGKREYGGGTGFHSGEVPVAKIYNRALTADEIRNNYRHYKTRFDI